MISNSSTPDGEVAAVAKLEMRGLVECCLRRMAEGQNEGGGER